MGPNKKKEIAHDQWEVEEEEDNPITTMVKVLLQEKVKELEDRIKLLVSLSESQKREGEGLSNNLRRENHCLKEELASVKASTRKSLEQNKEDLEDMAERFFAENASIEKRLVLAEEKIRTLAEDNGKLEHESLLKESMNSELLSALNQKEEELKQVMTETIKVRSEKEECKKEIKQVMDQFTRKINQLQETNMIVEMKNTTLGEENLKIEKEREILRDENINLEAVPSGYPNPTRYPVFLLIPDPTRFSFRNHRVAGNPKHRLLPDISVKPEVSGTTRYFGYHP